MLTHDKSIHYPTIWEFDVKSLLSSSPSVLKTHGQPFGGLEDSPLLFNCPEEN